MAVLSKLSFKGDKGILFITVLLSIFSVLAVFSSASSIAVFWRHLGYIGLCFAAMFLSYFFDYRKLAKASGLFLILALILLVVTLAFGNDVQRGINIGIIEIQTFYFVGFLVIFFAAWFLSFKVQHEAAMNFRDVRFLFLIILGFTGGMALSNMSTAIIFFTTSLVVMFVGNVRFKHLIIFFAFTVACGSFYLFGTEYGRSSTFKHRCNYYITNDNSEGYGDQMIKSKAAIARSGLHPTGPGQGVISKRLPEKDTDYVFTTVTEEFGVITGLLILIAYLIFFYRSIQIAKKSRDTFGMLLALGIGFWFCCQGLVHIGVNCGLLPATGQTLPFISRGGSSLLFSGIATGMLLNISKINNSNELE